MKIETTMITKGTCRIQRRFAYGLRLMNPCLKGDYKGGTEDEKKMN